MSMLSPTNIRRIEPHAPTTSPLLGHFTILRDHLFQFLTTPDFIALLWTSRVFQEDAVVVDRAFEANADVGQFLSECRPEWCPSTIPEVTETNCFYAAESDMNVRAYNEANLRSFWCPLAPIVSIGNSFLDSMIRDNKGATRQDWLDTLSSPDRCAALLSLAWRMKSELRSMVYSHTTPNVMVFISAPFILPLARLRQLSSTTTPVTEIGCHVENFTGENGDDVACALCKVIPATDRERSFYDDRRNKEQNELRRTLHAEGHPHGTPEYNARIEEDRTRNAKIDSIYRYEQYGEILRHMCADGRLPPLRAIADADEEALEDAVHQQFYSNRPSAFRFCKTKLRTVVAFFRRHGFGPVQRPLVKTRGRDDFDSPGDEIRSVEMVGAEAPEGFFAGVYYIARDT